MDYTHLNVYTSICYLVSVLVCIRFCPVLCPIICFKNKKKEKRKEGLAPCAHWNKIKRLYFIFLSCMWQIIIVCKQKHLEAANLKLKSWKETLCHSEYFRFWLLNTGHFSLTLWHFYLGKKPPPNQTPPDNYIINININLLTW